MNSSSFLVACLDFLCMSCHLQTVTVFLLFLNYFYFFSSLIAMAWASKTVLNNSGESGHPCLIHNVRGNAFSFSPLRMMFAVGLWKSSLNKFYYFNTPYIIRKPCLFFLYCFLQIYLFYLFFSSLTDVSVIANRSCTCNHYTVLQKIFYF